MRKLKLLACASWLKSGCVRVQPGASARPGDGEEGNHSAGGGSIGIAAHAGDAYGSVLGDEGRNLIVCSVAGGSRNLRIDGWAGASHGRLRVAAGAAIEIEARAEAFGGAIDFIEDVLAGVESGKVGIAHSKRQAGAGGTLARPRIGWAIVEGCLLGEK